MSVAIVQKIENILKAPYNTKNFVDMVREIFPDVKLVAPDKFRKEYSNFSSHIEGSIHVGIYRTPDKKNIIIMAVELNKSRYVENSRSTQRSYAKKLIENGNADAAFVAFYTSGNPKWRLSFVRLDYEMKIENGKLKTAENMTPAKRYSYLVGEGEPCHTAISRFERFIMDNMANPEHPTLDGLEEAFSVEKVTDEFFQLYCEKFYQLQEQLESNEDFKIEAQQHNYSSAQFAKKLMGQIVFLYFLQKKGWLGVGAWPSTLTEKEYKNAFYARGTKSRELIPIVYKPVGDGTYKVSSKGLNSICDADEEILAQCVKGKPWGTGPQNFMRKLYELAEKRNVNFYDELLEPLFYGALNVNRGEQGYCPALHCRIPFLSGGLFEPIDGYDWEHNDFAIPNEVFSNAAVKGKRDADGILDIFDRYNFTMSEDEPMEREVAIDPEMLGKVFENLLEINDRKSKGAFYTPREIVHYMCQESLINYLANVLQIEEEAIRSFILYGDFMKDEDTVKEKRQGNGGMFISDKLYALDQSGTVVVNRLLDMDQALKDIRVADPAVGSGAFPLGMLNEIVRARQNISAYLAITMSPYDVRMMYQMERSPHELKYETIKNCIFASDIEPSAVDIAQLRLWLSLVIDDEINPDAQNILEGHRNPLPLPNLECNILCGNSLLDEFEDIKLINESELIGTAGEVYQRNMNQDRFDAILTQLISKQDELFRCDDTNKKHQLLEEIASLRDMIIMSQMYGCDSEKLEHYQESKKQASKPYVLWQLDFARVFKEKGGFDIVIGNPPYIQLQKEINEDTGEKLGDQYKNAGFESFARTGDIYCLFYEKGYSLLRENGVLSFITSNKWMRAGYGKALRGFFAQKTNPLILIDFAGQKIFESATVDVNILMFSKAKNEGNTVACIAKEECRDNLSVFVMQNSSQMNFTSSDSWTILSPIEQSIKRK
ncbi:MAG: class I SAM-dependent DNA methyltransferase, partial [Clostridiales bacterium]|nr:class I SAM-dependent DNA methyltransferase [Clostridiales bacterium]